MQTTMEEKHIYLTPLSVVFEHILVANISEAFTQFQKKLLNLFYRKEIALDRSSRFQPFNVISCALYIIL